MRYGDKPLLATRPYHSSDALSKKIATLTEPGVPYTLLADKGKGRLQMASERLRAQEAGKKRKTPPMRLARSGGVVFLAEKKR